MNKRVLYLTVLLSTFVYAADESVHTTINKLPSNMYNTGQTTGWTTSSTMVDSSNNGVNSTVNKTV